MTLAPLTLGRAVALAAAFAAAGLAFVARSDDVGALDPLQRPAAASKNPSAAVLIAIARAGNRLVAVGDAGTVVLSDDGGAHWTQAQVPVGVTLTSVHFVDAQTGWAVGHSGVILATTDGGASWRKQLDGFQARGLAVEPALAGHGVPAAAGGEGDPLLDVHFEDARRGFAVGAFGRLLCTTDGGAHWRHCEGRLDNPDGNHLYAIRPAGGALVVVGERGSVYVSRDQGASFEQVASPYEGSFFGVHAAPDGRLLVYGLRGHVFASADQGRSWADLSPAAASSAVTGAATLDDGRIALVSQDGSVFVGGRPGEPLGRLPERGPSLSAAAASSGGALVAVGPRGIVVIPKPAAPPVASASASAS